MKKIHPNATPVYDKKYFIHDFKLARCVSGKETGLFVAIDFIAELESNLTEDQIAADKIEKLRFLISPGQAEALILQLSAVTKNKTIY